MRKSDALILVAVWDFLTALGLLIGIVAIAVLAFPDATYAEDYFGLSVGMIMLLAVFALSIAAGVGLIAGREWGRILAIIQAAVSLLFIPFGTIIGTLTLIYLTRARTREYFEAARK